LYDLSASSTTSVASIVGANQSTTFVLSGPGFSAGAGGAITITANLSNVGDPASLATAINAGIAAAVQSGTPAAQALTAANITAEIHTGADGHQQLLFTSPNTAFNVTAGDTTANGLLGNLGTNTLGSATGATATPEAIAAASNFVAGGTQEISGVASAGIAFTDMVGNGGSTGDAQTLTFTANSASGVPQTATVSITAGTVVAFTATDAIAQINQQLQATDNPALQNIVASVDGVGGNISFSSNSPSPFSVSTGQDVTGGTTVDALGLAGANTIVQSAVTGVGATSSIATQSGAEAAVSALATSVATLGSAQAAVGRGENQFTYAINLAQSELTNEAAAESGIRDANLAAEAANLTKAQILLQAGVAALSQANAAPQNILALLKT
ncbi:MAG TPA: flagellin, partial [Bryobacteraceae bacterium]|nr:flagellin [Bryobacteraceae bacterium]